MKESIIMAHSLIRILLQDFNMSFWYSILTIFSLLSIYHYFFLNYQFSLDKLINRFQRTLIYFIYYFNFPVTKIILILLSICSILSILNFDIFFFFFNSCYRINKKNFCKWMLFDNNWKTVWRLTNWKFPKYNKKSLNIKMPTRREDEKMIL
jgi:hypothetical protein